MNTKLESPKEMSVITLTLKLIDSTKSPSFLRKATYLHSGSLLFLLFLPLLAPVLGEQKEKREIEM